MDSAAERSRLCGVISVEFFDEVVSWNVSRGFLMSYWIRDNLSI